MDVGQLTNFTLSNLETYGLPFTHSGWQFAASTPFQAAPFRAVPILGSGDSRYIVDFLQAGETAVYQIGCHTDPPKENVLPSARPAPPTTSNCGLVNPSFEEFAVVGRPLGWDFGDKTSRRDGRSAMLLDTRNPKHGRHSLRVIVPSATPLVFPVGGISDVGLAVTAGLTYNISFWARAMIISTGGGATAMRLDLLARTASGLVPDPGAGTAPAVIGATLTEVWQQISTIFVATTGGGNLQLRVTVASAGELFLDHMELSATKGAQVVC